MKQLRGDTDALMVNIGAGFIIGYVLLALASLAFWFHRMGWDDSGWMSTLWTLAPFIFGLGAMVIMTRLTMDPKFIIAAGIIAVAFYYIFFIWS
jgi:cadmium resistance protein CadD (predicted permease)